MHGNNFNSLNFQHGGYQDPFADLQQSLGAGGIFSQTLKQMNQDMYANAQRDRADEEFKWRKDDRQRQEDERNNAIGLYKAMNDRQLQADAGNQMFKAIGENGKADYYTDAKDSAMGGTVNANSNSIMDLRAKLADPKFANNSEAKRILGVINGEGGFDKQFSGDYANASKIGMLNDAYKLLGQDDATAQKSAAAALGTNLGNVSGVQKATDMQNKFIGDMEAARTTDPMLSQSTASVVRDYIAAHPEAQNDLNIMKTSNDMFKAEEVARAQQKQAIQEARDKAIQAGQNEQAKNLELRLKLIDSQSNISKAQMNAVFGGSNGYSNYAVDPITGNVASGSTGNGKDYNSEFAKAKTSSLSKLFGVAGTNEKNKDVVAAVSRYADELQAKGLNPDSLETYLRMSISSKNPEKGEDRIYTFNNSNSMAAPKATDIIDASTYGVKGKNAKDPELAIMLRDLAVNGEKSKIDEITKAINAGNMTVANAKANLANLERTPYQAMAAEAKEFELGRLRDRGEIAMPSMALQTDNFDKIGKGTGNNGNIMSGSQSQDNYANAFSKNKDVVGLSGNALNIASFKLPDNFSSLPNHEKSAILRDASYSIINQAEGTKKNPYAIYKDSLGYPTTGTGILVSGFEKNALGGAKYDPSNPEHRIALDSYQVKAKNDAINSASKQIQELGFSADALPILASVNYQLGAGWDKEFKQTYSLLKNNEYDKAISNIKKSDWYDQTRNRAETFIAAIEQQKKFREEGRLGRVDKYYAGRIANPQFQGSPQEIMIKSLQSGIAPSGPDTFITKAYSDKVNNVPLVRQQAEDAMKDYSFYSNQRQNKQELFNQHLIDDGKAPSQIEMIQKAGLDKQYKDAKSPKERLAVIADAQRKLLIEKANSVSGFGF